MKEVEPLRTVTMRELMEDARLRAGAQNFKGHDFMDLARFDEKTRHISPCLSFSSAISSV